MGEEPDTSHGNVSRNKTALLQIIANMGNHTSQESPDLAEEQFLKELSHGGKPHPIDEFTTYYQEWKLENASNKKLMKKRKVILITTGAFCPVHRLVMYIADSKLYSACTCNYSCQQRKC